MRQRVDQLPPELSYICKPELGGLRDCLAKQLMYRGWKEAAQGAKNGYVNILELSSKFVADDVACTVRRRWLEGVIGRFCKATMVEGQRSWLGSLDMPRFVLRENETFAVDRPWCLKLNFSGPFFSFSGWPFQNLVASAPGKKSLAKLSYLAFLISVPTSRPRVPATIPKLKSFNSRSNCSLVKRNSIDSWWSSLPIHFNHQWARFQPRHGRDGHDGRANSLPLEGEGWGISWSDMEGLSLWFAGGLISLRPQPRIARHLASAGVLVEIRCFFFRRCCPLAIHHCPCCFQSGRCKACPNVWRPATSKNTLALVQRFTSPAEAKRRRMTNDRPAHKQRGKDPTSSIYPPWKEIVAVHLPPTALFQCLCQSYHRNKLLMASPW